MFISLSFSSPLLSDATLFRSKRKASSSSQQNSRFILLFLGKFPTSPIEMIGRGGRDRFRGEYLPRFEEKSHFGRKDAPPSRHLWVGNLSPHLTEPVLTEKFLRFGEIDSIAFPPGRSYAFVNFKKEEDAVIAMRGLQGFVLAGMPMKIEFTKGERSSTSSHGEEYPQSRDDRRSAEHGEPFSHKDSRIRQASPETYRFDKSKGDKNAEPSEVLWVGFPSFLNINETILRRAFSPFGEIEKITAFPGRSYAFVQFRSIAAACRAKEALQGKLFDNPRVSICFAKSELGPSERGRNSMNGPFPHFNSYGPSGLGGQAVDNFRPDRNLGNSTGEFSSASPRFFPNMDKMPRDSGAFGFSRNSSAQTGTSGSFDRRPSEDIYEHHRSPAVDRGAFGHDFPPERPRRNPFFGETWELPEEPFPFREAKKLKTSSLPDKELPEYPFSDSEHEKQHIRPPKFFSDLPENESYDKNFASGPFDYKRIPDHLKNLPRPQAERDGSWKTHDSFEGAGSLPAKPLKWQQPFTPDSHHSPLNEEWKWEGTIAKGGTPVCRARCFPVGKVLDVMLPEFLNCTARTGLDMLEKHFYQAASFWVVFFVPGSDADIIFYNEFMHYLGEKQRAAVAKLSEKTTLFLVPPSEFSEKVLKVPGKVSISGVILRFQHPSSNYGSLHHPLETMDSKLPPRVMDGAAFHEDMSSYRKATSPGLMPSSWGGQSYIGSSSEPFPSSTSSFPSLQKQGVVNLPQSEKASDSLSESRYDQLHHNNPTLQSNWSPLQMRNQNSSMGSFPSLSFDESMAQKYLSGKPAAVQESASNQYTPTNSGLPLPNSKPQLSSSTPVLPLQPEQLAQLATLLGQRQQLVKAPVPSSGEDRNPSSVPNQPEQAFTSAPNLALQNHASASSDSLTAQFNQVQQLQQQQHASNVSAVTQANCTELPTPPGSSGGQGNQQLQNSSREETETDPQKRLQATLQLAATLLQQIQQQAKAADQR
ncbi:flowering time control protein FPA [Magnolia sinica]|uniref:flowering time control protein FPA n=1 Tax=Magnolia sinica TaxID=86752 RepID=UPI00265814D9|nr:flowering time control protein FPA [Magnolia sinica]XP_058114651.1 flowering time control protein FPA [Magnolia sinica]